MRRVGWAPSVLTLTVRRLEFTLRVSRSLIAVTLIAFLVTLSACSTEDPADGGIGETPDGFMTLADTQAEYDEAVADFPYGLPSGRTFPAKVQQPKQETVYQEGAGLVQAYQFWECAWMDAALTAHGDDQDAFEAALAQLDDGTKSVYRTQYVLDDDDNWSGIALAQAKLGDPSVLSDFYDADCIWYRAESGQ